MISDSMESWSPVAFQAQNVVLFPYRGLQFIGQTMRIQAIDDDPVFLDILDKFLRDLGYSDIVLCSSGTDALQMMRSNSSGFDCLLVDIQMPVMDGIELCKAIRRIPRYARTPVLMITSMMESQYIDAAFLAGASDYVTKPIKRMELKARLSLAASMNQNRARQLAAISGRGSKRFGPHLRFSDPVILHEVHGIVELVALKNYALTLGNFRMQNWKAIGFATLGASEFYNGCGPEQYLEVMEDVGNILFDTLKQSRLVMSYAGSGCFVALVSRHANCEQEDLEAQANAYLQPFSEHYREFTAAPIAIVAGREQRNSLLSFQPADGLISRAIVSAQERSAKATVRTFN